MKVLHLLDSLVRGGAETQALDVCRNAARFGLDLTLVTALGGPMEEEFRSSGVEFIRLERRFPVDFALASKLRRIITERQIGLVQGYQAVDGLHLYLACRGLRDVRRVLSFQGFIPDRKNRMTSKFLIPRMDVNIAVSRGLLKWLSDVEGLDVSRNFTVIYNGADPERLRPGGRSLRDELRLDAIDPLIGMIGNFYRDPRKDQLTVCKALPEVFAKFPNAHCVFAGKPEEGAEVKITQCRQVCIDNGIEERVHFLGGRSDVPDILASLDVFVFSSLHEGLPVAVSEAMLSGVAMIVSDIEPLLEATCGGEYADVFPVGDHQALAGKLTALLADPARRSHLADRAKAFAEENLSIDAHLGELTKLYGSLMRRHP